MNNKIYYQRKERWLKRELYIKKQRLMMLELEVENLRLKLLLEKEKISREEFEALFPEDVSED